MYEWKGKKNIYKWPLGELFIKYQQRAVGERSQKLRKPRWSASVATLQKRRMPIPYESLYRENKNMSVRRLSIEKLRDL